MLLAVQLMHKKGHATYDFGLHLDREPCGQATFLLKHKRFYIEWGGERLLIARLHPRHNFPLAIWSRPMPTNPSGWEKVPLQYDGGVITTCRIQLVRQARLHPTHYLAPVWANRHLSTLH